MKTVAITLPSVYASGYKTRVQGNLGHNLQSLLVSKLCWSAENLLGAPDEITLSWERRCLLRQFGSSGGVTFAVLNYVPWVCAAYPAGQPFKAHYYRFHPVVLRYIQSACSIWRLSVSELTCEVLEDLLLPPEDLAAKRSFWEGHFAKAAAHSSLLLGRVTVNTLAKLAGLNVPNPNCPGGPNA